MVRPSTAPVDTFRDRSSSYLRSRLQLEGNRCRGRVGSSHVVEVVLVRTYTDVGEGRSQGYPCPVPDLVGLGLFRRWSVSLTICRRGPGRVLGLSVKESQTPKPTFVFDVGTVELD